MLNLEYLTIIVIVNNHDFKLIREEGCASPLF